MRFSVAALTILCLAGDVASFAPSGINNARAGFAMPKIEESRIQLPTQLYAEPSNENGNSSRMANQVAAVVAASFISAASLGMSVSPIEPAFAAAPVATVAAKPAAKKAAPVKVPAEVAAVDTAKKQFAAASASLVDFSKSVPLAKQAERDATKAVTVAQNAVITFQKSQAQADERLNSLKVSASKFDPATIAQAEKKAGKSSLFRCRAERSQLFW